MSSNVQEVAAPEKKDDDELVVKRVVRERGSDRPKEIIVSKGGVECTVTPRQVVKIDDLEDFNQNDNTKTRDVNVKPKEEPEAPKEQDNAQPQEQESTVHAIYTKVADSCSNAYQSVKGWFASLF